MLSSQPLLRNWTLEQLAGFAIDKSEAEIGGALPQTANDALAVLGDLRIELQRLVTRDEVRPGRRDANALLEELRDVLGEPPQLATPARLDAIGAATRRLEQELNPNAPSPFVAAMRASQGVVGELQREIEAGYLIALE